jgi:hypothetical protein
MRSQTKLGYPRQLSKEEGKKKPRKKLRKMMVKS